MGPRILSLTQLALGSAPMLLVASISVDDVLIQACHPVRASSQCVPLEEQGTAANSHPAPKGCIVQQTSHGGGKGA